jgi:hypothetical protein
LINEASLTAGFSFVSFRMHLSKNLFWDVNKSDLSYEKHSGFIIARVFTKGDWSDFKQVINFYGKDKCLSALKNARYLDPRTLSFCSHYFEIDKSEFRCFRERQLSPAPWNY